MKARRFLLAAPVLATRPSSSTAATWGSSLKGRQSERPSELRRILKKEDDILPLALPPSAAPSPLPTWQPSLGPSVGPSVGPSWPPTTPSPTSDRMDVVDATLPPTTASPEQPPTTTLPSSSPSRGPTNSPTSGPASVVTTPSTVAAVRNSNTYKIALSPFRIDIVATVSPPSHDGTERRRLRHGTLRTHRQDDSNRARHLQTFFRSSQDMQMTSVISYHLLTQYQRHADQSATPSAQIVGVDLDVTDKTESVFGRFQDGDSATNRTARSLRPEIKLLLLSYTFAGDVVVTSSSHVLEDLDGVTLRSFTDVDDKNDFLEILASSDDELLRSITDVDATPVLPSNVLDGRASNGVYESQTARADTHNDDDNKILVPALISLAFLSTLSLLGYLTHKKYGDYQRNNANNAYLSYQQRKARLGVDTRYNPFESPPSSVTENETPTSRGASCSSMPSQECDGWNRRMKDDGRRMDVMMEDSSSEDERGWSSTSTSTDVLDWNVPYDEVSGTIKQSEQPYDERTRREWKRIPMGAEWKVERSGSGDRLGVVRAASSSPNESRTDDDATLDGLYSTNDSYFDANTARSERNHGRSESFDTLNCSVDVAVFGVGWERETIDFEGIGKVVENEGHGRGLGLADDSTMALMTDVTKILLENNVERENDDRERTEDIVKIIIDNNLSSEKCTIEEIEGSPSQMDHSDNIPHVSSISEHDKTMHSSEEDCCTPSSPSDVKTTDITSKHASYKSIYDADLDPSTRTKANISAGIFTHETLGMINRNRLKATPPPSENDYDEDMVKDATENTLLGWMVDTDSDEDSLFDTVRAKYCA